MSKNNTFYCWWGVFEADKPKSAAPTTSGTSVIFSGGRPPPKKSATKEPDFDEQWWVHESLFNLPGKEQGKFHIYPGEAFEKRNKAEAWIEKGKGKDWADQAIVYSLMSFCVKVD